MQSKLQCPVQTGGRVPVPKGDQRQQVGTEYKMTPPFWGCGIDDSLVVVLGHQHSSAHPRFLSILIERLKEKPGYV